MSALQKRTQEITAEYWAAREATTERLAVAQLALALARAEGELVLQQAVAQSGEATPPTRGKVS